MATRTSDQTTDDRRTADANDRQATRRPPWSTGDWRVATSAKPPTGEFVALDQATGKTLWQFKTGSSVNATVITYTYNGRQFITIASGRGGTLASRYTADRVPTGGSIWTFALLAD